MATRQVKIIAPSQRDMPEESPFMSLRQVLTVIPLGKSTLYLMIRRGEFPPSLKIGQRAIVWRKKDVTNWINKKLA